jgi:hypothetical protein
MESRRRGATMPHTLISNFLITSDVTIAKRLSPPH